MRAPAYRSTCRPLPNRTLRAWRAETARGHAVAAYVVFHDATVRDIATRLPTTTEELGTIGGFGEAKLTKYAKGVIGTLAQCSATVPAPASAPPAVCVASAPAAPAPAGPVHAASPSAARPAAPDAEEPPFDLDEMPPAPDGHSGARRRPCSGCSLRR
ncbi:HRDC domain-containing protein [Streptomyces sp. NC-S4]